MERQMVWGGCAAMVIRGKVLMEPIIAQVLSHSLTLQPSCMPFSSIGHLHLLSIPDKEFAWEACAVQALSTELLLWCFELKGVGGDVRGVRVRWSSCAGMPATDRGGVQHREGGGEGSCVGAGDHLPEVPQVLQADGSPRTGPCHTCKPTSPSSWLLSMSSFALLDTMHDSTNSATVEPQGQSSSCLSVQSRSKPSHTRLGQLQLCLPLKLQCICRNVRLKHW